MIKAERIETTDKSETTAASGRRTDRVQISIPVEAYGIDIAKGCPFCVIGYTWVVSRHGAAIVLNYPLAVNQKLIIRCLDTNKEAEARIVGAPMSAPGNNLLYGLELLNSKTNAWGIEFPSLSGQEGIARLLLQCHTCRDYKVFHFSGKEFQDFETNQSIPQYCKTCSVITSWRRGANRSPVELPQDKKNVASKIEAPREANERKHIRIRTKVQACIRESRFVEEIVSCEDLSRGGIRFRTMKPYKKGTRIEVAVPYTAGSGNIFVLARIAHVKDCTTFFSVGVAYVGASERTQRPDGYAGTSLLPDVTSY